MPRIKICGVTRVDQAMDIARCGADAIGLNFVTGAARRVDMESAAQICGAVQGRLAVVGLFVDAPAERVQQVLACCALDYLQFNGEEDRAYCEGFGVPYLRGVRMRERADAERAADAHPDAAALLLDAHVPGLAGGTGQTFDWALWPRDLQRPLVLAGGLNADNVGAAIAQTGACAVDVAGGVESDVKGIKDMSKVRAFIDAVRVAR